MTRVEKDDRLSADGRHKLGWLISVGLHGSLLLGALLLLQQMQLAVMEKPFEWNVAMVQPAAAPQLPTTASESPPVPPMPKQSQVPVQTHPEPVPAQPLPPPVVSTPAPIETHITPPRAEQAPPPPIQATALSKPEPTPEPIREEPRPQPHAVMKSPDAPPVTAPASIPTPVHAQPSPEPPSNASPVNTTTSTPEPTPVAPEPVRTPIEVPQQPLPTPDRTADASTAIHPSATPSATEVAAVTSPVPSSPSKPDDGWLSALMAKWLEDLTKHYPATARQEGVHGKVVLVAVLHEDGTLTDVRIAKSSGNALLDQAAIADVEQGPPIKLSRPLGRPQRTIKLPISYDLRTGR